MRVCTDRCFGQDLVIPTSNDFVNAAGVRNQSNRAHIEITVGLAQNRTFV